MLHLICNFPISQFPIARADTTAAPLSAGNFQAHIEEYNTHLYLRDSPDLHIPYQKAMKASINPGPDRIMETLREMGIEHNKIQR